ncbi:MAG: VaFE repeat-containing surface-anchored protein [Actinomyces urogenitalis]|uniref:VaFE repeat-containing surface-anchored protein n=1 Tax=Actinomyces urogenitalis TaxID=103621 RepID=UPI00290FFC44|nr:VaFE repeat-containing surface-anchored protein [Actinomyces urogenitalis]MDU6150976.1 VaFE repeat-containing surface-anchored protein [Actinomyces urogenitalis]
MMRPALYAPPIKRVATLAALVAVTASGMAAMGLPEGVLGAAPTAQAAVGSAPRTGHGYGWNDSSGTFHWLGANADPTKPGGLTWCIEFGPVPPTTAAQMGSASDLVDADHRPDTDEALRLDGAQAGWLLTKYEPIDTEDSRAALALIVHANFDVKPNAAAIVAEAAAKYPSAYETAKRYVAEARTSTPQKWESGSESAAGFRKGSIKGLVVKADNGMVIPNIPVTLTIVDGPAVFDETGTNVWKGVTGAEPLKVTWTATGNGTVTTKWEYDAPGSKLVKYGNDGSVQDVLGFGGPADPQTGPGEPFRAYWDFQPIATSNVAEADSKVVDHDKGVIRDTIHVKADPNYKVSPEWMHDAGTGELVPVVFEGTAYYTGDLPAGESAEVPADAKVVGTTKVTAKGPGDYTAEIRTDLSPDVITWVWKVVKADQGKYADYVAADWSDHFGVGDETTSVRDDVEIDSTVQSNVTKSGTYLVDNLYIDGFDEDHTTFEGDERTGFKADVDTMDQTLYFFPKGVEVLDANLSKATKIATVSIPAVNGYVDRVGSGKFKMLEGDPEGTYVFVTSFAGDDRTEAYTSSVEDKHEQVTVTPTPPEIKTTATDKVDGDKILTPDLDQKVTITDKVCQVEGKGLKPGKTYVLNATAMDKATGQAILDKDGKPYVGTAEFTPKSESDCGMVDVTIPASALRGKKVVMFENVTLDGRTVALHTDIEDEGQTVDGPPPSVGTTLTDKADGDHEVSAGPVTLEDKVCPKDGTTFEVGKTYKVTGTLMDRSTGKPLTVNGKEVTSTAEFTPKAGDDCALISFQFDTTGLDGRSLVAFETVYKPGSETDVFAEHKDLKDEGQTVHVKGALAKTGAAVAVGLLAALGLVGGGSGLLVSRRRRRKDVAH